MECEIASYHIDSFNFFADTGLKLAALDVPPVRFNLASGEAVELSYLNAELGKPVLTEIGHRVPEDAFIYPSECRQRGISYRAPVILKINATLNGNHYFEVNLPGGEVPVMLRSNRCHLQELSEAELVKKNEEPNEQGGYFIVKGSEKVIRLLIANRSNYPFAINRNSYKSKGKFFTEFGIMMRSVKEMHSIAVNVLHYLTTSMMSMSIQYRREIFYVPLMYLIRALTDLNELQIYECFTRGRQKDTFFGACVRNMLRNARDEGVINRETALKFIGNKFRVVIGDRIAPWATDEDAAEFILKYGLCIHQKNNEDKFFTLIYMAQKLVAHVQGEILAESPDSPQFQEASVSGHILLAVVRERLEDALIGVKRKLQIVEKKKGDKFAFTERIFAQLWGNQKNGEVTHALEYLMATGTLLTKTGLGLMQTTGFSVMAERINQLRFVSHFRAVHRGSFFMEMRTTDARKLRPEAWGFICPVHTPDGAPCGLLNHVTASCRIVCHYTNNPDTVPKALISLGVVPHKLTGLETHTVESSLYTVFVDGNFIGYIDKAKAPTVAQYLRRIKVNPNDNRIPSTAEIVLVRFSTDPQNVLTQYPGLYVFTNPGRFVRPVKNLCFKTVELVGTFEQVYLSIIIDPSEAEPGVTMHQELHPSALFSFAGNLIPFPDHNQSPRNVYQCQMGKQTMGVPIHAWHARNDNKMYRLQFPQKPLLKPEAYDMYKIDDNPLGTNACVAVISYTGYDMEDAMVINKSSYERGFAHGTVIKVEVVDLNENVRGLTTETARTFARDPNDITEHILSKVDIDGLPIPGRIYRAGDVYYSAFDGLKKYTTGKFKSAENAVCGSVRVVLVDGINARTKALIQWRIQRNPIIGDKFASRHGQKGINSYLWPQESLPFSESGMVPDIIFNPHGFPSRMTIGMMIESMAGKAAAMHGKFYDASPFVFNDENTAIDHFGDLLQKAGYSFYGDETLYSGVDGRELKVQIFFGVVYYQRLRHMIADKFQVRSTGPVDPATLQPVKGRKKGGGVRFGEMERDSLIAHGTAFCILDRFLLSSDVDCVKCCSKCGSMLSNSLAFHSINNAKRKTTMCRMCNSYGFKVASLRVPRVLVYLAAELAAMNINLVTNVTRPC